ncbi:MAG: beta-ketoacyl-[acyl-carrier-protein] synthase family protein [Opitutales bacterium]|nr:beta-ketoacyl-[acyl-carrier-protein] synthase family protein [Opitutales bacterium]MCH8540227.1 beta-ketoacyl-[acyl-carrier-protein] synthase family protein [Opitutales bacterium]
MIDSRIVITGLGLTSPNGNNLSEYRQSLLSGKSGISNIETRYMGTVHAGMCDFEATRYQKRKEIRVGTRGGSIAIYCAREALNDSGLALEKLNPARIGVYLGITEHGNVETENEIYNISQFNYDTKFWSHHHNPRTVANNPAGEVTVNMGITGPHYTIGAACAAGNAGIIQGAQMLRLGEVDQAFCGGVSESPHTFGIFAAFKSQGALAQNADPAQACRPFDQSRNGIVVSEGGCVYTLERLEDAQKRGAKIYGEVLGYALNSDANDFVLPFHTRQAECMHLALQRAQLNAEDVDIVSTHATATKLGDVQECMAVRTVFDRSPSTFVNNTKSFIGHTMGAAGALELAGNLPSFEDNTVHPTINLDEIDPECSLKGLLANEPREVNNGVRIILNNSFGMLGINSAVIIRKFTD